jgi:hypothetical protein
MICAYDGTVLESDKDRNTGSWARLELNEASGSARRLFSYFSLPFPIGAIVTSAKLRLWAYENWDSGTHTLTARRITESWIESGVGSLTWNKKPAFDNAVAANQNVTNFQKNQMVEIDVTAILQAAAAGSAWYGLRVVIETANTTRRKLWSSEAADPAVRPQLVVTWVTVGSPPTGLIPNGARSVSVGNPILSWVYESAEGNVQTQYNVQIDATSDFAVPIDWDSGWVVSGAWQSDPVALGMTSLPDGSDKWWRVRVQDSNGNTTDWSDPVEFKRTIKGVLTMTSPAASPIDDTSPVITHTFTGKTQESVQYLVYEAGKLKYDSGRIATTVTSFMLPEGVIMLESTDYQIIIRVWDTIDRIATPGDFEYVEASRTVQYVRSGVPAAVNSITQISANNTPELVFQWSRTSRPDYFAIRVDGQYYDSRVDPALVETTPGGNTYQYTLWNLTPRVQHTVEVEAVVLSTGTYKNSSGNPTLTVTLDPRQKWLLAPTLGLKIPFIMEEDPSAVIGEEGDTFFPVGRRDPVRITGGIRGYEGSLTGSIFDYAGRTTDQYRQDLETIKSYASTIPLRLVWAKMNIGIIIGAMSIEPSRDKWYGVSIDYWQVSDYTFQVIV